MGNDFCVCLTLISRTFESTNMPECSCIIQNATQNREHIRDCLGRKTGFILFRAVQGVCKASLPFLL